MTPDFAAPHSCFESVYQEKLPRASFLMAGTDPTQLEMYHFTDGQWVGVEGTVNTTADTITVDTTSFSPFALGLDTVPEPASISLLALAGTGLLMRRRNLSAVR